MAFIMHQVHALDIQHCVNKPSKLVFCSLNSKKLYLYLKASLSGLPTSSLTPELFDLSSTKRPKTGVQIAQVCIFHIMLFGSLFLASYLSSSIGQRLVFRLHWCLTNTCGFFVMMVNLHRCHTQIVTDMYSFQPVGEWRSTLASLDLPRYEVS